MRTKLIQAAIHQYALHGYHGATMRKIADEVGIKPASIYFFYKNKEELFIAAFKQLLENHFEKMKDILEKNLDQPVDVIFIQMVDGIVEHHTGDMQGTDAYISLVTSPIDEISSHLKQHMLQYNEWLVQSLESILKENYPAMPVSEIEKMMKKFVLIGNGVFWGIKLYEAEDLKEQVLLAKQIIQSMFEEIHAKYDE